MSTCFFDNLAEVLARGIGYDPECIYNCNETGIVKVQRLAEIVEEKKLSKPVQPHHS